MRRILAFLGWLAIYAALAPGLTGAQEMSWDRTFGGTASEGISSVQLTPDGGYILAGWTASYGAGGSDGWLIKTDAEGVKQWDRTFGGAAGEMVSSVQLTSDGGYILAGRTFSYGTGGSDGWLIKTDGEGAKEWDRTFGGADWDGAASVQPTLDGGYILAGWTRTGLVDDVWLIKTDAEGIKEWDRTFGWLADDRATSVKPTLDGGYILAGKTFSYGAGRWDAWLIKTDAEGVKQWDRTFGGIQDDEAASVQCTPDGGYILAGRTRSYGTGGWDAWLIKTDAKGTKQWERTFGEVGDDEATSMQSTPDGGYILAGKTRSYGSGGWDLWLIKTDAKGMKQWDRTFGGSGDDGATSVQPTLDGGYILAGKTFSYGAGGSDGWLIYYRHDQVLDEEEDVEKAITWEFETDGETEGWIPFGMLSGGSPNYRDVVVEDGVLKLKVAKRVACAYMLSPRLDFDTDLLDRIEVRARINEGAVEGWCTMSWRTPGYPESGGDPELSRYRVRLHRGQTCTWSEEWRVFEAANLNAHETWSGTLERIQLFFQFGSLDQPVDEEHLPDEVWVDRITLTGIGLQALEHPLEMPEGAKAGAWFDPAIEYGIGRTSWFFGGDLDGDGWPDLAVSTQDPVLDVYNLVLLFNEGDGTFERQERYPLSSWSLVWGGDLDGDGEPDVVVTGEDNQSLLVYVNEGDGKLREGGSYRVGEGPSDVAGADFDGDGDVDLVVANYGAKIEEVAEHHVSVLFNRGDGTFEEPVDYYDVGEHPGWVWAGDLDGDGDADMVVVSEGSFGDWTKGKEDQTPEYLYTFFNDGTGGFGERRLYQVGSIPGFPWGGDLNGDGAVDLVVVNNGDNCLSVLINAGDGHFQEAVHYDAGQGLRGLCGGDFDGDGDLDLAVSRWVGMDVVVWANEGDGRLMFEGHYPLMEAAGFGLEALDIDGDGDLDIVGNAKRALFVMRNRFTQRVTSLSEGQSMAPVPRFCVLYPNVPNPFNSMTFIPFDLSFSGRVRLGVYDVLGRRVRTLVEGPMSPGHYTIPWDGRNELGHPVASGRYVYRLQAGTFRDSKTMTLIR